MAHRQYKVTFQPQGRAVSALEGTTILEAAAGAGLVIDTPCGGAGTCGKCRIRITQGASEPSEAGRNILAEKELADGWRLACQSRVRNDLVVHVPTGSLFGRDHQIGSVSAVGGPAEVRPTIRKVYVELAAPTLEDPRPDLLRLEAKTGPFTVNVAMLRHVPGQLRKHEYKGTAVLSDHQLIDFEAGDTTASCFGVAADIGTTTMVVSLLDLCSGEELATAARMNPQVSFGDDVLSRIHHSTSCPHCLEELREAMCNQLGEMIRALCDETGINARSIYQATFAGNTTMQHLLCGVDPAPLGAVPFAPAYGRGMILSARDMGIPINAHATSYVFPVIGGFVGGDTVAGMLTTRVDELEEPVLMVDIGTNGEIVLVHNGQIQAASTAAGPAFEGARISCGMRGARGAIEKVLLDEDVHLGVIGDTAPMGICGSGLIDLVAELLRVGIVSSAGRLHPAEELPSELPPALADRLRTGTGGEPAFILTEPDGNRLRKPLSITQRDIRELQLGCGAIRAGISILLRKAGLGAADLKTVLIAGGFGGFVRRDKAQRIGLLPRDVDHQRIHYVGNVSLAGARWTLLSLEARKHGEQLARRTQHVELSVDTDFQMEFAEAMIFPEA